ncbi:unnamed protein product [Sphagnum balticum]
MMQRSKNLAPTEFDAPFGRKEVNPHRGASFPSITPPKSQPHAKEAPHAQRNRQSGSVYVELHVFLRLRLQLVALLRVPTDAVGRHHHFVSPVGRSLLLSKRYFDVFQTAVGIAAGFQLAVGAHRPPQSSNACAGGLYFGGVCFALLYELLLDHAVELKDVQLLLVDLGGKL